MPDTNTANYELVKPEIAGSEDSWGDKYHATLDVLDGLLKEHEDGIEDLGTRLRARTIGKSSAQRYFPLGVTYQTASLSAAAAPSTNTLYLFPILSLIEAVSAMHLSLSTTGTGNFALGIYDSVDGRPSELVHSITNMSTTTGSGSFAGPVTLYPHQWVGLLFPVGNGMTITQANGIDAASALRVFGANLPGQNTAGTPYGFTFAVGSSTLPDDLSEESLTVLAGSSVYTFQVSAKA